MSDKLAMKDTFHFDEPGTIRKPGPIGRIVRLLLGALCLWLAWRLAFYSDVRDLTNPGYWMLAVLGLMLAPYVVNIGFGVTGGAWPRIASLFVILGAMLVGYLATGNVLSQPFWATVTVWMVYLYSHLGTSFMLSSVLATPGCEMRAFPHLFGLAFKQQAREHYCPGFIENIDHWEYDRKHTADSADNDPHTTDSHAERDFLNNAGSQLLFYGLPFVALQLAGNLAGFTLATAVPAGAFLFVGIVCLINAIRSRRVHCYFLGPWCLAAGVMTALYSLRYIDFGSNTWSLIVNTGLAGAFLIYMCTEKFWGKYFGEK